MAERLTAACGSPGMAWLTLLTTLLSAYLITYLICVGSMWGGLFGSPLTAPLPALIGTVEISLAVWIARHWERGYEPTLRGGLWVALAVKLLLAEYLFRYDRKRFHIGWAGLGLGVLIWAACTAVPAGTVAGLSDAQLLVRFRAQRDETAFVALVARHGPMVMATCRAIL